MLAHFVETEIMPRCAAIFDLHSGGKASFFTPCTLPTKTVDAGLYQANLELAETFGLPLIWRLGSLNDNRSVNAAAERAGVPMIAAELGGGGGVDPGITDLTYDGLRNCLRHLGVLTGEVTSHPKARMVEIASPHHTVYAPAAGLFDRTVSAGEDFKQGQTAGVFHFPQDPDRASIDLTFPESGFVLAHTNRGYVQRGEMLAMVVQDCEDN